MSKPLLQMHAEDVALVQRLLDEDRSAFETFFDSNFSRLYRFAMTRLGDEALCEDLVQETLVKAIKGLHQYRGEAALFTWLCQICRHEMSGWLRKNSVKNKLNVSLDDDPGIRAVLESAAAAEQDDFEALGVQRMVHLTLDYLPDKYGKALEWKYVQGLSVQEIAEKLEVTVVVVQSLLARARQAFRTSYVDLEQEMRHNS